MPLRPPVSVVVPFLGDDAALDALAARLCALERQDDDELIVADNRPGALEPLHREDGVVVHPASAVRSPGFARNRGAARARGDWIVFIDADTVPERDLLGAYFNPPPTAATGVMGGAIVDVLPAATGQAPSLAARHAVARGHMAASVTLARPAFAYAQTANCAVRRRALVEVGGFAEDVRAGEDADLCFRLAAHGWRLEHRPDARVAHEARATTRAALAQLARHGSGAAWCERRHPGSFPPPTPWTFARRVARSTWTAARAAGAGDREAARFALLEVAEAVAFEGGRLLPNHAAR